MKRIGVLTSGGDGPGLNPCIRAVVRKAIGLGLEVMGIKRGYAGLMSGEIVPLNARSVSSIINKGGTFLGTSRPLEFETVAGQLQALHNLNEHEIEGLVVIGGNGSLCGALALHQRGFPVVGIPATIDNDVNGTDLAIGVDTALNTIIDAIDKIRDTAASHHRAFLIEVMGRDCGYLALVGGVAGGAEIILLPEVETSPEEVARGLQRDYVLGKAHCIVVVAEGYKPGTKALAEYLQEHEEELGFGVRVTVLGHVQRGGAATAFDRLLATRMGAEAVDCLMRGEHGCLVAWRGGNITTVSLEEILREQPRIDLDIYKLGREMEV
ncbi:MAG: 6-phosphofructokinase [Anaerolineae bacterium]